MARLVALEDIEIAEVYDAMAAGEMLSIGELGFHEAEEVARLVDKGYLTLGGKVPVSPSSGWQLGATVLMLRISAGCINGRPIALGRVIFTH